MGGESQPSQPHEEQPKNSLNFLKWLTRGATHKSAPYESMENWSPERYIEEILKWKAQFETSPIGSDKRTEAITLGLRVFASALMGSDKIDLSDHEEANAFYEQLRKTPYGDRFADLKTRLKEDQ